MSPAEDIRALLDQVPAILYVSDLGSSGEFRYVNRWIEPIIGFTAEEWCADTSLWATQLHPDDRDWVLAAEDEAAASQDSPTLGVEYRMLHRDGHTVWIRDEAVLRTAYDGALRWYGVLSDITDRKHAELALERQAAAQAAVAQLGEHALERVSLAALFEEACAAAVRVLGVDSAMVGEVTADHDVLEIRTSYGRPSDSARQMRISRDSQAEFTLTTGKPSQVDDWSTEQRFTIAAPLRDRRVASSVSVRIEGAEAPFGILGILSQSPRVFLDSDVHFAQSLANILSDAVERQRIEDDIEHRALHDALTTLPNRVLFLDRLEHALEQVRRRDAIAAALFIDLDHFKQVNDTLGHQVGDELLVKVAARLREAVRPSDTVARFGGDEFGLLLEDITTERDAVATAERIASGFTRPFTLESGPQFITASIGIALTDGRDLTSDLMRDADTAMYRAKERGRARYELFDDSMRERALARSRMESELCRGLENNEFRVRYRSIVGVADGAVSGIEAVVRWNHPERGEIRPPEFIPVADETGVLDRLGQWVIEEACRDAAGWTGLRDRLPLWLNVSISELANARFPDMLEELITSSGMDPSLVGLELRERVLSGDAVDTQRSLARLKSIGVRLAVDDFGSGQLSLSQVVAMPIDALRLDRRFVSQLCGSRECERVTRSVIALADALDLELVAKGVETPEQLVRLSALGCTQVLGPLFSVAVSAREMTSLLLDSAHPRQIAA